MGVGGRTATLVVLTVLSGVLSGWLARRDLRAAAESLTLVSLGLLTLDLFGAADAGWFGGIGDPGLSLLIGLVLAAAAAGAALLARRAPVRTAGRGGADVRSRDRVRGPRHCHPRHPGDLAGDPRRRRRRGHAHGGGGGTPAPVGRPVGGGGHRGGLADAGRPRRRARRRAARPRQPLGGPARLAAARRSRPGGSPSRHPAGCLTRRGSPPRAWGTPSWCWRWPCRPWTREPPRSRAPPPRCSS